MVQPGVPVWGGGGGAMGKVMTWSVFVHVVQSACTPAAAFLAISVALKDSSV